MKNILILIPLLFFFSCNNKQADDKLISRDSLDDILIGKKWEITKIDPLNTEDIRGTVFDFNANGSMKALYYDFETDNMALDKGTWNLRPGNELLINVPFLGGLEGTIIKYSDSIFVMEFKSESDTVLIDFSARDKTDKPANRISGTYSGNIDGRLEIVMALEQANDKQINGLYYYKKYKKKINISGIIESNEVFLNEYCNDEMTGRFTGKITDDVIHGTWTNYDGSKKKDFFLKRTNNLKIIEETLDAQKKSSFSNRRLVKKWLSAILNMDYTKAKTYMNIPFSYNDKIFNSFNERDMSKFFKEMHISLYYYDDAANIDKSFDYLPSLSIDKFWKNSEKYLKVWDETYNYMKESHYNRERLEETKRFATYYASDIDKIRVVIIWPPDDPGSSGPEIFIVFTDPVTEKILAVRSDAIIPYYD